MAYAQRISKFKHILKRVGHLADMVEDSDFFFFVK